MNELALWNHEEKDIPIFYEIEIPDLELVQSAENTGIPFKYRIGELEPVEFDDVKEFEFDEGVIERDKLDYLVAVSSGALTAILDIFWVGDFTLLEAEKWGSKKAVSFVLKLAKKSGYKGKDFSEAVKFLDKDIPVSDSVKKVQTPENDQVQVKNFTNHPSVSGLCFSLLTQFTGMSYGSDKTGNFSMQKISDEAIGNNFIEKIYNGVVVWAVGMAVLMAGEKKQAIKGKGIPSTLYNFISEVSRLPVIRDIQVTFAGHDIALAVWISKLFRGKTQEKEKDGAEFDIRKEMGITHEKLKQVVPVILNECIVRAFYSIRRMYHLIKQNKISCLTDFRKLDPKKYLPFNNRTVNRMITISSGTFVAIETSTASVIAAIKSKGNGSVFMMDFLLNINYVGIGRFVFACVADAKDISEDIQTVCQEFVSRLKNKNEEVLVDSYREFSCLELEQNRIALLFSLKMQKTLYDIQKTKNIKDAMQKKLWLEEWKMKSAQAMGKQASQLFIEDENILYEQIKDELHMVVEDYWLYVIMMEMALFEPYFSLDSEKDKIYKKLKYKGEYEKEIFCKKQSDVSEKEYDKVMKLYRKYEKSFDNTVSKTMIGLATTTVATVATGGLGFSIAAYYAGKSVMNSLGTAGKSAHLSFIGGNTMISCGSGESDDVIVVTGGGAILGIMENGVVSSSIDLFASKENTISECSKLLTFCKYVLIGKYQDYDTVSKIQYYMENRLKEIEEELKELKNIGKHRDERKIVEKSKDSIRCIAKCCMELKNMKLKTQIIRQFS